MIIIGIVTWIIFGYISALLSELIISRQLTTNDLSSSLIGCIFGPLMIIFILCALLDSIPYKVIIKLKNKE